MSKKNVPLTLLSAVCLLSILCMAFVLCMSNRQPDFSPPPFDPAAENGIPMVPEDLGYQTLDAQVFYVGICGKMITADDGVDVWFTNPNSNEVWLKLRVVDINGTILGETGLITPGQYVKTVALNNVPESGTPVVLKLMAYEPETYYSAGSVTLNTAIY